MATKTKKPTTTKKPAAKKTAVVKAHRGMAHVPRGRRRPIGTPQLPRNPRRRPQVEPRRLGDDRPRGGQQMTPAMRRRLMELRRRAQQRRQLPPQGLGGLSRSTPAQQKAARDRFIKMQEANKRMRANVFGRGRKPTQATQTPKVATPRKRPTGTPRGPLPQVTPRKRNFRFRGRR